MVGVKVGGVRCAASRPCFSPPLPSLPAPVHPSCCQAGPLASARAHIVSRAHPWRRPTPSSRARCLRVLVGSWQEAMVRALVDEASAKAAAHEETSAYAHRAHAFATALQEVVATPSSANGRLSSTSMPCASTRWARCSPRRSRRPPSSVARTPSSTSRTSSSESTASSSGDWSSTRASPPPPRARRCGPTHAAQQPRRTGAGQLGHLAGLWPSSSV